MTRRAIERKTKGSFVAIYSPLYR